MANPVVTGKDSKDGRKAMDTKTTWDVGETIAARKPINLSTHERSPLS